MEEPEILIVDDNPEIREVAMVLLQGEGFTVGEAGDGKEALDKIEMGIRPVWRSGKNQMSQSCFSAQELRWKIRSWDFPAAETTIFPSRFPIRSCSAE